MFQRLAFTASCFLVVVVFLNAAQGEQKSYSNWWAFQANGDKPGTGYVLIEKDGKISSGHFFMLFLDPPDDDAGRFFPMRVEALEGNTYILRLLLKKDDDKEVKEVKQKIHFPLDKSKNKITVKLWNLDANDKEKPADDLHFTLQGDQWAK